MIYVVYLFQFILTTHIVININIIINILYRMASKANGNIDDPGAFPAREWLRDLCVGKQVAFETRYVL